MGAGGRLKKNPGLKQKIKRPPEAVVVAFPETLFARTVQEREGRRRLLDQVSHEIPEALDLRRCRWQPHLDHGRQASFTHACMEVVRPSRRVALAVSARKQADELRSSPGEARPSLPYPDGLTMVQDDPMLVPEVDMLRKTNDIVMTVTGLLLPPLLIAAFGVMLWQLFFR